MNHSQAIKLAEARQFLIENPTESKAMTVRLFDVNARQAGQAEHAGYDPAEHDIDQKFLPEDFFDDMYDN